MERKNLKSYEVFLILSVILQWAWGIIVERMSPSTIARNIDEIIVIGGAVSFFFYTMIIVTIQALIYNVRLLEPKVAPVTAEERASSVKSVVQTIILCMLVIFLLLMLKIKWG